MSKHFIHIKSGRSYHTVQEIEVKIDGEWTKCIQYEPDYEFNKEETCGVYARTRVDFIKHFADPSDQELPPYMNHHDGTYEKVNDHEYYSKKLDKTKFIWKNLMGDFIDASGRSRVPFTPYDPNDLPF